MNLENDLYSICYDILTIMVENLEVKHESDLSQVGREILDLLTNNQSSLNQDLKKLFGDYKITNIQDMKRIMLLMIPSKSYMNLYYDKLKGIDNPDNEELLMFLDTLDYSDILNLFYSDDVELVYELIDCFIDYTKRPYIFENLSKEEIINHKLTKKILELNPFEVLNLGDYLPKKMLINSEVCIQSFLDIYDKSLSISINDDEFSYNFMDNVKDYFLNDSEKINTFIQYAIANIYETLITYKNSKDPLLKDYYDLINVCENFDLKTIIFQFLNNSEFRNRVVECFVLCNDSLVNGDLICKRNTYKDVGNIKTLKRLNPFYIEEEIVFNKIKETSC